jgi:nicotianamine synthase
VCPSTTSTTTPTPSPSPGDVARRLDAHGLAFRHGALTACADLAAHDLVVVAALVGLTPDDKRDNLRHLHRAMAPGAVLVGRSAHGLRALLYTAIPLADLAPVALLSITRPDGPVINSVVLARKPAG